MIVRIGDQWYRHDLRATRLYRKKKKKKEREEERIIDLHMKTKRGIRGSKYHQTLPTLLKQLPATKEQRLSCQSGAVN